MTTSDAAGKSLFGCPSRRTSLSLFPRTFQVKTWKHRFNGLQVNSTIRVIMSLVMGAT